ncbi:hypothetical protein AALB_2350 [Agarivorans albus MKT 106]|uniref:Uncharacterized protein n=1 Tax=Agarivorans albus MKT 106 TaxID=1331007 RepID=R9PLS1_AGAAL|nr:hypothetical protein AALB_2350 [Agarivorans albus MKT 106]
MEKLKICFTLRVKYEGSWSKFKGLCSINQQTTGHFAYLMALQ